MKMDIKIDDRELKRFLRSAPKKIRYGTKNALDNTAKQVVLAERRAMKRAFDRPTPWILNGLWIRKAHTRDLTAIIQFKDKGGNREAVVLPHIHGGRRKQKASERALAARGRTKGKRFTVPGKGVRLNRYGNVTRAQIQKLLSDDQYFVGSPGGRPLGVYKRMKRGVKPMMIFTNDPYYRKRFDYFGIAERTIKRRWPVEAARAIKRELRRV